MTLKKKLTFYFFVAKLFLHDNDLYKQAQVFENYK